ncbi:hypothetical protein Scep_007119 [Stephania cephalantha]|uniref:Uncharacterized protein n=1 Tax=Stephania cephalantha TaxID=152367 RepID=A0AAP0K9G2_9MAGN
MAPLVAPFLQDMARCKAIVTRKETSSEPLGGAHGHGGQKPLTTSYQKEKQKIDTKGSHVVGHREMDLIIAHGGTEGEISESFEDLLENDERVEGHMGGTSSDGGNRGTKGTRGKTEAPEAIEAAEGPEAGEALNPPEMKKSKKKTRRLLYSVGQ